MGTPPHEHHSDVHAAAERIRELNERILQSGQQAGLSTLDVYEKGAAPLE
jgi:hypothetical protein